MVRGEQVSVDEIAKDRFGRTVAMVSLDRRNVNQLLVRGGYAWVYSRYCQKIICKRWKILEWKARLEKTGLWAADNPVPPWEWRKKEGAKSLTDRILDIIEDIVSLIKEIISYMKLIFNLFAG